MTFPVKWYSSDMEGAAFLSSGAAGAAQTTVAGSLIALLKSVLVTGFGIKSVSSLVYSSATQTITATVAAGHKYLVDQVVELSGANESGFNGEFRVLSITSTNVVMGLDNGTPSAANATGTLSMKIPSLGWVVEFEDAANYKIIFKRTDPASTPLRMYIDNSAWSGWNNSFGYLAKVQMIENPTDINTFTVVNDYRWPCSHSYATPGWGLIGDSRMMYFVTAYAQNNNRGLYMFGDGNSVRPGDNYFCLMTHYPVLTNDRSWGSTVSGYYNQALVFSNASHKRIARSYHQLPGSVAASWKGLNTYFGEGIPFPNPSDNGFYVSTDPVPVHDDASFRGTLPGIVVPYASPVAYDKTNLNNLPGLSGKLIRFLLANREDAGSNPRLIGFDIKGPWR